MYAIVKTGGKQYRVERGQRLLVERLPAAEGSEVTLQPILFRSEEAIFDKDGLAKVKVTAKVLSHERGEKLRVFKFKPKRGYKRRTGHRQELTRIEVTELGVGAGATTKKAKETVAKESAPPKATAKPAAAKPAAAKPAAAKPAAAKPAAAKPAAAKPAAAKRVPAKPKSQTDAKEASEDGA
ncbi:MAG TPA: 50S ribosomal protein L21 [Solirubrobacteraceae bacterium]|nr:50S ribosomal protein L21 [Solirubrobacteraceae bacterium]